MRRRKKSLKMPSLLAFLLMFERTNENFDVPHYKGKKNRSNGP
jgi:hypothetical protein